MKKSIYFLKTISKINCPQNNLRKLKRHRKLNNHKKTNPKAKKLNKIHKAQKSQKIPFSSASL